MGESAEIYGAQDFHVDVEDLGYVCDAIDNANGWNTNNNRTKKVQNRLKHLLESIGGLRAKFDTIGNWIGFHEDDFMSDEEAKDLLEPIAPWVNTMTGGDMAFVEYRTDDGPYRWCWNSGTFGRMKGIITIQWTPVVE